MIYVVEVYRSGANVFRTGANFLTWDTPDPERLGVHVFWTEGEAKAAHDEGAAIFADHGPAGYLAYQRFTSFLQQCGLVPKPEAPALKRRPQYRRRL
jgi:hypothetical protein